MKRNKDQMRLLMRALAPAQAMAVGLPAINTLLNGFVIGHFMGSTALAAIGFAGPLVQIPATLSALLANGAQLESGQRLGRGDRDGLAQVFNTTLLAAMMAGILLAALITAAAGGAARLLGASGETMKMTSDYLIASAPGMFFSMLFSCMVAFLQLERAGSVVTTAAAVMLAVNTGGNLANALVFKLGVAGAGLSTSLANLAAVVVCLPYFLKKSALFRFSPKRIAPRLLGRVIHMGIPSAVPTFCCIFRDRVLNAAFFALGGNTAMAAIAIALNLNSGIGATIEAGYANSSDLIASVLVGEGDVDSLRSLPREIIRFAYPQMIAAYLLVFLLAKPLGLLFGAEPEHIVLYAAVIRLINGWYLTNPVKVPSLTIYRALGKVKLVSISHVLNLFVYTCIVVLIGRWTGSLYLAAGFTWISEIMLTLTFVVYYRVRRGKLPSSVYKMTDIPNTLTAPSAFRYSQSIRTLEDAARVSEEVIRFCEERGVSNRNAKMAGLCIEELATDSIRHTFAKENQSIDLRLICEEGSVRIMLRDNGTLFDPKAYLELADGNDERRLGLKLAAACARKMEYNSALGLNVIRIEL